ncbi:MAG: thermonuclease family protein [Desulfovibrio sp.]|jgi:endonuclease YncB( thermonuclease family)|nr:thermonuclease family protein [Desulfovibrio sp.]
MKKLRLLFFLSLFAATPALAWEARIVAVTDGDTLTVEPAKGGDRIKVRLHGIDAPESRQPYGQAAKGFVNGIALYKRAEVDAKSRDRYGRTVAIVTVPGKGVLQELLLDAGLAWVYPQYCKSCSAWEARQAAARKARKGLWADSDPVPPWKWRKDKR